MASGPVYVDAPAATAGKTLLYLYRPETGPMSGGRAATFTLDDKALVELPVQGYAYVYVAPGYHELKQTWPIIGDVSLAIPVTLPVVAKAGDTIYVRFSTNTSTTGYGSAEWQLTRVDPALGSFELHKGMRLVPADPGAF
jgi:hypothetical protein